MNFSRCPLCDSIVDKLIVRTRGETEHSVVTKLRKRHPAWSIAKGLCERCLYLNEYHTIAEHFSSPARGTLFRNRMRNPFALLPLRLRLDVDPRFSGRGITIAFIDSGFHPHPDILHPDRRILRIHDVTDEGFPESYFATPHVESWHGMMTSVVACGNGHRSKGLYRGLAYGAQVILLKVLDTRTKHITSASIERAVRWVIEHRMQYGIRILSMSVGADEAASLKDSSLDRSVEEAVQEGIIVVAASGNNPQRPVVPPASAPSALTVGGLNDQNELHPTFRSMYNSSFGPTIDGLVKPELIAPAMWVAAPILPGTEQEIESEILFKLLHSDARTAKRLVGRHRHALPTAPASFAANGHRSWARTRIAEMGYVAPFHKTVDGTSFAAPIVSSVVAQMLEANPLLSPAEVKQIVVDTAEKVTNAPSERQGSGVLRPRQSVARALERLGALRPGVHVPLSDTSGSTAVFVASFPHAGNVQIAMSSGSWKAEPMHRVPGSDLWVCCFSGLEAGTHAYKYLVDETGWREDPHNSSRIHDGHGGSNSVLAIHPTSQSAGLQS